MLSATGLRLYRGERRLFENLDFALAEGEMLLVEGPNGSGKTSLLRAIAGLLSLDTGAVLWRGKTTLGNRQALCAEMGWLSHRLGLKYDLSLVENLAFDIRLRGRVWQRPDGLLERLGLSGLDRLPLRALSAGQQRRVALARLMLSESKLWLMDEPLTNLDSAGQALVRDMIERKLKSGGLCVIASHHAIDVSAPIRRIRLQ
ncbi:MAG TPA: cytochrome c biogenesis heme-transporting ATPase CcmA [Woeseiaceae bacterium]|nr:cytochrome c biogenesis heme-transporting ATPase CcmA [Woeseiaceae bacterium]